MAGACQEYSFIFASCEPLKLSGFPKLNCPSQTDKLAQLSEGKLSSHLAILCWIDKLSTNQSYFIKLEISVSYYFYIMILNMIILNFYYWYWSSQMSTINLKTSSS